jgi:hypothetical protein
MLIVVRLFLLIEEYEEDEEDFSNDKWSLRVVLLVLSFSSVLRSDEWKMVLISSINIENALSNKLSTFLNGVLILYLIFVKLNVLALVPMYDLLGSGQIFE